MAAAIHWPNAFGTAPTIASLAGNYVSGTVRFVSSTHPAASDANAGTEPELPKATLVSAFAASSAHDVIILGENHAETISVAQTFNLEHLAVIGLGSGSARPRLTSAVAGVTITVSGNYVSIHNLYFPASTAATTARLSLTGSDLVLEGCDFECGANDTTTAVLTKGFVILRSLAFTATAYRPARAIRCTLTSQNIYMEDILIDGGGYGWSADAISLEGTTDDLIMRNVRLANNSDVAIATGANFQLFGVRPIDSTNCRVTITP